MNLKRLPVNIFYFIRRLGTGTFLFVMLMQHDAIADTSMRSLSQIWQQEISGRKLQPAKMSFCFIDEAGQVQGNNISSPLSIASFSKVFTSLLALYRYQNLNYQFETKIYYSKSLRKMHITGGKDPLMGDRKIWWILSFLNAQHITHVDELTFDDNFYFFPTVFENHHYEHQWSKNNIRYRGPFHSNSEQTSKYLSDYMNTAHYQVTVKNKLQLLSEVFPDLINKSMQFDATQISYSANNPLLISATDAANNDATFVSSDVEVFSFASAPLQQILKYMNTYSNNVIADLLFQGLGEGTELKKFLLASHILTNPGDLTFYTGSGIPLSIFIGKKSQRLLNQTNCTTALKALTILGHWSEQVDVHEVFTHFDIPQNDQYSPIENLLPVAGREGTIARQTNWSNSFMAKTGSLRDTRAMSGAMITKSGFRYFALFGNSASNKIHRITTVFNNMIQNFFHVFHGQEPMMYQVPSLLRRFLGIAGQSLNDWPGEFDQNGDGGDGGDGAHDSMENSNDDDSENNKTMLHATAKM